MIGEQVITSFSSFMTTKTTSVTPQALNIGAQGQGGMDHFKKAHLEEVDDVGDPLIQKNTYFKNQSPDELEPK